jgi:hypothetical protein
MQRHLTNIVFGLLVAATVGIVLLGALVASGHLISDDSGQAPARRTTTSAAKPPPPPPPAPQPTETQPAQPAQPVVQQGQVSVQIVASRGDCWVAAHKGSADGAALVERLLRQGEKVTLRGRRIWLELGAAGNVDVLVNGRDRPIPSGTTNVVLG